MMFGCLAPAAPLVLEVEDVPPAPEVQADMVPTRSAEAPRDRPASARRDEGFFEKNMRGTFTREKRTGWRRTTGLAW